MEAIPEEVEVEVEAEGVAEVQAEVTQADVSLDMSITQSTVKPLSELVGEEIMRRSQDSTFQGNYTKMSETPLS